MTTGGFANTEGGRMNFSRPDGLEIELPYRGNVKVQQGQGQGTARPMVRHSKTNGKAQQDQWQGTARPMARHSKTNGKAQQDQWQGTASPGQGTARPRARHSKPRGRVQIFQALTLQL
eukprot:scaffold201657_cov20-Tisochrysis_lutea.AAC.3